MLDLKQAQALSLYMLHSNATLCELCMTFQKGRPGDVVQGASCEQIDADDDLVL